MNISQLDECLVVEIFYENKNCIIVSLYRSPSQSSDEFESFVTNFENMIYTIFCNEPYLVLIMDDFNATLRTWRADDSYTLKDITINVLTQIISEPTHILRNSSSFIDLIFCN